MKQTNKDKLKFKIARGILLLTQEPLSYRKKAIIELFRIFDNTHLITEEGAKKNLSTRTYVHEHLSSAFIWLKDEKNYNWLDLKKKLFYNNL